MSVRNDILKAMSAIEMSLICAIPVGLGIAAAACYRVSTPSEYLVRTGLFINGSMGMNVSRKAFLFPGQTLTRVSMTPRNFQFNLKCLSKEYIPFEMPITCTVTPFDPHMDSGTDNWTSDQLFKLYTQRMETKTDAEFKSTIMGVIHGETRMLCTTMTIDEINDSREGFRENVVNKVQELLFPMGIQVNNVNIAELIEEQKKNEILQAEVEQAHQEQLLAAHRAVNAAS